MPKSKNHKKRNPNAKLNRQLTQSRAKMRLFDSVISDAYRRSKEPGAYERTLGIPDETWIRDFESTIDLDSRKILNVYAFGSLSGMADVGAPPLQSEGFMKRDRDQMVDTFALASTMMLTKILMGDEWTLEHDHEDVFKALASVEQMLPDKYYDASSESQYSKHLDRQYADTFSAGLADMIDWDRVTKGNELRDWCANIVELTKQLAVPERIQALDGRKPEIIERIMHWFTEQIHDGVEAATKSICNSGLIPDPAGFVVPEHTAGSKPNPGAALLANARTSMPAKADIGRLSRVTTGYSGRNLIPGLAGLPSLPPGSKAMIIEVRGDDEPSMAHPWTRALLGSMNIIADFEKLSELKDILYGKYPMTDILWTAVSVLAEAASMKRTSGIAEHLGLIIASHRFATEYLIEALDPKDEPKHRSLKFKSFTPHACPEFNMQYVRKRLLAEAPDHDCDPDDPDLLKRIDDVELPSIALWQIISNASNVMPPEDIEIRLKWKRNLREMGYNEREATALCGYIEGLKAGRMHTMLGGLYTGEINVSGDYIKLIREVAGAFSGQGQDEEPGGEAETEQKPAPQADHTAEINALRSEYERRMQRMHENAENRVEAERKRVLKIEKAARHGEQSAEQVISGLTTERNELLYRLKRLESENKQLKSSVMELSLDAADDYKSASADGVDDGETPAEDIKWPSAIGSDCTIRVFGGDGKWLSELSRRYPHIEFTPAGVTPNQDAAADADIVIVNTFCIKHKAFWPIRSAREKAGKQLDLFPSKGINACSRHIMNVYEAWSESRRT